MRIDCEPFERIGHLSVDCDLVINGDDLQILFVEVSGSLTITGQRVHIVSANVEETLSVPPNSGAMIANCRAKNIEGIDPKTVIAWSEESPSEWLNTIPIEEL